MSLPWEGPGEWIDEERRRAAARDMLSRGWTYIEAGPDQHLIKEHLPQIPRLLAEVSRANDLSTYHWVAVLNGALHDTWHCSMDPETGDLTVLRGYWVPAVGV